MVVNLYYIKKRHILDDIILYWLALYLKINVSSKMAEQVGLEIYLEFYFGFAVTNLRLHINYFSRVLYNFSLFSGEC